MSQYRALVTKFRAGQVDRSRDWFLYLSSHYELQCRTELHQLFKLSCLCLPPKISYPPKFTVPLTELGPDEEVFRSCVAGIQISYNTVPIFTSLYKDPRSISLVSRSLGRGRELLPDRKFSIWNFLRGSALRRGKWFAKFRSCVAGIQISYNTVPNLTSLYKDSRSISLVSRLLGRGQELLADRKFSIWNFLRGSALRRGKWFAKFETAYKSVVVSPSVLHPTEDSDVASEPQTSSSSESPTARLNLGKATVALASLQDEAPCGSGGTKRNSTKSKKN